MPALRRFGLALLLGLALAVGQQAAALHDLAHARERLAQQKDSIPAPHSCDKCFVCSGLVGGAAMSDPPMPCSTASEAAPVLSDHRSAPAATRLAFLSRAPPALL